jgi:hypothetical protein
LNAPVLFSIFAYVPIGCVAVYVFLQTMLVVKALGTRRPLSNCSMLSLFNLFLYSF